VTTRDGQARQQPHHSILALRVTGGFVGGANLEFVDGLNCLIGGRGAGKTTALEFLRFGLGLMPDPKASPQRHRSVDGLVKANLGGGRISVDVRTKKGMRYTAGRGANETVQVLNEAGSPVPITLDRDLIFSADVFSQNEIEEIAYSPAAQLTLLDRFSEEDSLKIATELDQIERQLGQSTVDMRRVDQEIDDLRARASELPVIEERLKSLAPVAGPDAEKINHAHLGKAARVREEKLPDLLSLAMQKATREVTTTASALRGTVQAQFDASIRDGANRAVFQPMEADVLAFVQTVGSAVTTVTDAMRTAEARVTAHRASLAAQHVVQEAEYRAIISQSEELGGREAERAALQASLSQANAAVKEQQAKELHRQSLGTARGDLLRRASELRDIRFALRKRVAENLTRQFPSIRVTVTQSAELQRYRDLVADALKGAGVKQGPVAERLSQVFLPTELCEAVIKHDYKGLAQKTGFDDERSRKVVDALGLSGAAYTIEAVEIDDRPCIELLDGETYKEAPNLSTGQRCTTILPILLVQSERPLLIDQPEDNLDNAFVFDTIVTALNAVKGARQIIFVTHNPNIPVLGEAERVFVFGSDGKHASVRQFGNVDECKVEIERILEGGRAAFMKRKERYGY